jgi:hypothetical protein
VALNGPFLANAIADEEGIGTRERERERETAQGLIIALQERRGGSDLGA